MDEAFYGQRPTGFRLPATSRLGAVRLQVADLERSIAFYTRTLGFHLVEQADGHAELSAGSGAEPLIHLKEQPGAESRLPRGRLGLFHFAILLPDRAALGRILPHLADRRVLNGASDHLVSEALYLQDPDGLGIEIYADRPRSEWQSREQELVMDTLPLDVEAVVQAAGGEEWAGLPADTRIGHIHLHVRDLTIADAFFSGMVGFDKMVWSYPGALFFGAGGYHHHVGANTWAGPSAMPQGPTEAQLIEWELVLPSRNDVEQLAASLDDAEHRVKRQPGVLLVRDPSHSLLRVRAERL